MAKKTTKKGRVVRVPWDQAGGSSLPDGVKVVLRCTEVEESETNDGTPRLVFRFVVVAPKKYKGEPIIQSFTIPKGLTFMRPLVKALLNKDVPRRAADLDLDALEGKLVVAETRLDEERGYTNLINYEPYGNGHDDDEDYGDDEDELDDEEDEDEEDDFDDEDEYEEDEDDEGEDEEEELPRHRPRAKAGGSRR